MSSFLHRFVILTLMLHNILTAPSMNDIINTELIISQQFNFDIRQLLDKYRKQLRNLQKQFLSTHQNRVYFGFFVNHIITGACDWIIHTSYILSYSNPVVHDRGPPINSFRIAQLS